MIPAASIGLPTTGAVVTGSTLVPAGGVGPTATVEYCLVSGDIMPIDPKSPNIKFQVALPTAWNGKALMLGGGGFNGSIPKITGPLPGGLPDTPSPLARGYAVIGDDGGHPTPATEPGSFLLNDEAYRNWMGEALKKTHDAAVVVMTAAYGKGPTRAYFIGGSTGGREGLLVAGRWPADWSGVMSLFPARDPLTQALGGQRANRALAAPGAWLDRPKRAVLFQAALAACDELDGVKDGLISNVKRCNAIFNPATATLNGKPVRCPDGVDTGDACLSDAQLAALATINGSFQFSYKLATPETSFPGYNVYTSDNGIPSSSPIEAMVAGIAMGLAPPTSPNVSARSFMIAYGDDYIRYGIARDPSFDSTTFDPEHPDRFSDRLYELSKLEAGDSDLSAFAARGGKLILLHGTADVIVSPRMSEVYYAELRSTMGPSKVASFMRFYEAPGFSHGVAANFNASLDYLTALENWTEKGVDPANNLVVTDTIGVPGRTRPLCAYPAWPKYRGAGDVNSATSFSCATE